MITDADIAARHPDLPGLAVLLGPELLAATLEAEPQASAVSGSPAGPTATLPSTGYRLDRLRIKPGASVSAILRPAAQGPWLLARAFAPRPWETKRHKDVDAAVRARLFAREWPACRLVVVAAASDRRLRGLARLHPDQGFMDVRWPPGRAAADAGLSPGEQLWGRPVGYPTRSTPGRHKFRAAVRTLSHNPARRWVGLAEVGDRRLALRLHRGRPPQMLPWQPGRPWAPGDPPVSAVPPPGALAGLASVDVVARVAAAVRGLAMLHRPWGERARAVAETIEGPLARVPRAPAHGDLTPDQVVVAGDRVSVLDWDEAGWWPVGWDAATWTAGLIVAGWGGGAASTAELAVPGGEPVDPAVLAAAAILRGPEPFRRRHPQWADRTERLLAHAESLGDVLGRSPDASRVAARVESLGDARPNPGRVPGHHPTDSVTRAAPTMNPDRLDEFSRALRSGLVARGTRWRVRRAWPADSKDATQGYVLELAAPDGRVAGARLHHGRTDLLPEDPALPALADQRAEGWRVLAHRVGKRAVLRQGDAGPFRKLATPKATRRAARRADTVDVLLAGSPVPPPPARLGVGADRGVIDLAPAEGIALRALLADPASRSATIEAAGRRLGGVLVALAHITPERRPEPAAELPSHTLLDEATVLQRWVSSAVALAPMDPATRHRLREEATTAADALAGQHPSRRPQAASSETEAVSSPLQAASSETEAVSSPLHAARSETNGVSSPQAGSDGVGSDTTGNPRASIAGPVLAHRDLHDGQVLVATDGRLTILDWDTAAWADPCLDPANLLAHLDLLVTQEPASFQRVDRFRRAFLGALSDGSHPAASTPERLELLVHSASVRIRAVHAFRGSPAYADNTAETQRGALS